MIGPLLLLVGIALIAYGFFKWATINDKYWERKNVPHLKPYFMLGNTGGFSLRRISVDDFLTYLYKSFPNEKIFGAFDFRKPFLFIRDPDIVKQLAIKDFDYFEDHRLFINPKVDPLLGNSLIMLRGEKWRDMRATLSPAFTGSKMKQMFELICDCSTDMSEYFRSESAAGREINLEMKDLYSKYASDVIASTAFGIRINSFVDPENEFYVRGRQMMSFGRPKSIMKFITMRLVPWFMQAIKLELVPASTKKFFMDVVINSMNIRKERQIFRPDMINILMQVKDRSLIQPKSSSVSSTNDESKDSNDGFATAQESKIGKAFVKRQWPDDELVSQCVLFFAAGFNTASTSLAFISHELAMSPDVQDRLYQEICETNDKLNGKKLLYDELSKMKYMDMVISEALRMWPPAMFTDRLCVKDYEYNDGERKFTIEAGTACWISIYSLQMDPLVWPNPKKFDPERFNDENKVHIQSGYYIPFGVGPRNCIGSRFALMEVKAVLYYLLLHFSFVPNEKTQIPLKLGKVPAGVTTERGVHLQLKPRF